MIKSRKYKALFLAAIGSEYYLAENGWEVHAKNYLPKKDVLQFLELLGLSLQAEYCGIQKYTAETTEASLMFSEDNADKVESIYFQCYGDKDSIKYLFSTSRLSKCAEIFDPAQRKESGGNGVTH